MDKTFRIFSVGQARAKLHALVAAVQKQASIVAANRSEQVAVIIPIEDARRFYPEAFPPEEKSRPNFAELLMSCPVPFKVRRRQSSSREVVFELPPSNKRGRS